MDKTGIIILGLCILVLVGCSPAAAPGVETQPPTLQSNDAPYTGTPSPTQTPETAPPTNTPLPVVTKVMVIHNGTIIDGRGGHRFPMG
jgi:hypothetical protein